MVRDASGVAGGQVRTVEIDSADDALQSIDLATDKDGAAGSRKKDDDGDDEGKRGKDRDTDADRDVDPDEEEGYSPNQSQRRLQAARRGEKRAKTRTARLERELTRVSVDMEGLRSLANKNMADGARDRQTQAKQKYEDAWKRRNKAFDDGKSEDWARADADLRVHQREYDQAGEEFKRAQTDAQQTQRTAVLDDWLNDPENAWFDPAGRDADSKYAIEVSRQITQDGFPQNSVDHFNELTKRIKKSRPDIYKGRAREEEEEEFDPDESPRKAAGGQQQRRQQDHDRGPGGVQGGRRDQGDTGVIDPNNNTKVPRELVKNFAAAGYDIDDPKVKSRMIKRYNEYLSGRTGGVNVG